MNDDNIRYSREDLNEFDQIIQEKLTAARKELSFIKETLNRSNDTGTNMLPGTGPVLPFCITNRLPMPSNAPLRSNTGAPL